MARKMVYTGSSNHSDTDTAVKLLVENTIGPVIEEMENGWALAFCGGRHDPETFLTQLKSYLGDTPIYGGASVGIIMRDLCSYSGFECGLVFFDNRAPQPVSFIVDGLDSDEKKSGMLLAKEINSVENASSCILFYDSLRSAGPPPQLQVASILMEGFYEAIEDDSITVVGSGLLSSHLFNESYIFDGKYVRRHAACALVFDSTWTMDSSICHGCVPISGFHTITEIDGARVLKIDGENAYDVLMKMFKKQKDFDPAIIPFNVTLGKKHGDPYASDVESAFVNRLILSTNAEEGSFTLFEADFKEGDRVQIMSRTNELMVNSARQCGVDFKKSAENKDFHFLMYIDCAGRVADYCGASEEESLALLESIPVELPFLGFFTGVELAPIAGRTRPLDWTGVLTVFSKERKKKRPYRRRKKTSAKSGRRK